MQEPDTWIVGYHTQSNRVHRGNLDRVATHRVCLSLDQRRVESRIIRCVVLGAIDNHGFVSMQMASREHDEFRSRREEMQLTMDVFQYLHS